MIYTPRRKEKEYPILEFLIVILGCALILYGLPLLAALYK